MKYATPHLQRSQGHVIVVASALSFLALPAMASYAASKAGVEMLALAYRQEVAHLGVTVGLVHPSWIDTDLVRGAEARPLQRCTSACRLGAGPLRRRHPGRPGRRLSRRLPGRLSGQPGDVARPLPRRRTGRFWNPWHRDGLGARSEAVLVLRFVPRRCRRDARDRLRARLVTQVRRRDRTARRPVRAQGDAAALPR